MSNIPRRRALGDDLDDLYGDAGGFDLSPYRGATVLTESAWKADVASRGGVITVVPGGTLEGLEAGRFGNSSPYLYELPPTWIMLENGIDISANSISDLFATSGIDEMAENQFNHVKDLLGAAGNAISGIPTTLKWAAIAVLGLVGLDLLHRFGSRD